MKFILLLCALGLSLGILRAQTGNISAPCARVLVGIGQDSVEWSAQPCASFSGYEVYGRSDSSQAFALLATIADPNQQSFIHSNPSEGFWQYQIRMICTGQAPVNTIITDNQRPVTPDLRRVYIVNNQPILEWDSSPSADVIGYQVYKENPYGSGNFFPYPAINQLQVGNQFVDVGATDLLVRYAIVAVSPCNKSLLGEGGLDSTTGPHTSIFMSASIDTCAQALTLTWNAYENWRQGTAGYQILAATDNGPLQVIDTALGTSYTLSPIPDDTQMRFVIRAMEAGRTSNQATSNEVSLFLRANRPMDFCYLTGLTVTPTDQIEITWRWDTDTDYEQGNIWRDGASIFSPPSAANSSNTYTDPSASPNAQSHNYYISSLDACGFSINTAIAQTIFLQGAAKDNYINRLAWSPFAMPYVEVQDYQVFRLLNGSAQRLATVADTIYNDALDIHQDNQANACYYVVANAIIQLPNQPARILNSRSNTICLEQNPALLMPNAFAPNGHNRIFRPAIAFGRNIQNYNLLIFDRYGKQIFSSNDPHIGWDGLAQGNAAPQGVYVYRLQYQQPDGQTIQQQGTVMLLR